MLLHTTKGIRLTLDDYDPDFSIVVEAKTLGLARIALVGALACAKGHDPKEVLGKDRDGVCEAMVAYIYGHPDLTPEYYEPGFLGREKWKV